jgi:DNA-directed RNA polymerase subunit RPC12/RpoP
VTDPRKSTRSLTERALYPTMYYGRRKTDLHDFVTFRCSACSAEQTLVLRMDRRTSRCSECQALHRILPAERRSTLNKET